MKIILKFNKEILNAGLFQLISYFFLAFNHYLLLTL